MKTKRRNKSKQTLSAERVARHGWTWGGFSAGGFWVYIRHHCQRTFRVCVKPSGKIVRAG